MTSPEMVNSINWLRLHLSGFSTVKLVPSAHLHSELLKGKSLRTSHTSGVREPSRPLSLKVKQLMNYLQFFCAGPESDPHHSHKKHHVFIHLFDHVYINIEPCVFILYFKLHSDRSILHSLWYFLPRQPCPW